MNSPKHVALVAHDAGGAELLASYADQTKLVCNLVLAGPAIKVFERRFGALKICSLADALSASEWCLCGTSWQSDLEWSAIAQARIAGKRAVAFLDHWVNYPERFVRNGVQHYPDELWVPDEDAQRLASKHFPQIPLRLVPNPYLIDVQRQIAEIEATEHRTEERGKTVLLVSENISDHARLRYGDERYWGYTEFDAIEYFFENIKALGERIEMVVIRPHPSDPAGKYDRVVAAHSGIAQLSDGSPLLDEIAKSDIVVGCQSMAMVVGLKVGKKVVSCLPPASSATCGLPHKNIVMLRDIATDDAQVFGPGDFTQPRA